VLPFAASPYAFPPRSEPPWFQPGAAALLRAEPAFARIVADAGALPWYSRPRGFPGLLRTICGQQVSQAAAERIFTRLTAIPGALDPFRLLRLDDDTLCGQGGLTRARAAHARAVAQAIVSGELDFPRLEAATDAEAMAMLTAIRGLGPWSAEVYLVLGDGRADVMPAGDIAVIAGLAHLEGTARPSPKELRRRAEAWAPWRSIAARLLWHHWLFVTGRPLVERC
jgi:DNA-3-methyladenine glycosylase II